MVKSIWIPASAVALVALTAASAAAKPPQGGPVQPPMALTVICPDESIQAAVGQAEPGTPLTVTVEGICTEEVVITADDVTVQGNSILDEVVGGFTVNGARRVTIKSLTIRDSAASFPVGVFATRGAAVVLDDIFVSGQGRSGDGGAGIYINRNAHADIRNSTVQNPLYGDNALLINDGAVARVQNSTFSSANGDPDNGAAVGLFRSASARFDGDIFIENSADGGGIPVPPGSAFGGGLAVQVLHTSNLRIQNPGAILDRINGDVVIGNNSAANLRGFHVGGDILVSGDSNLTLRAGVPLEVQGTVTIQDQSLLSTSGGAGNLFIPLGVACNGPTGGVINAATIAGGAGSVAGCTVFP